MNRSQNGLAPRPRTSLPRRALLLGGVLATVAACHLTSTTDGGDARSLPNVVLILADDLGSGDLSLGDPNAHVPTPHLDALASEGMRLTDAHSPSAVCTPTRYGLLTGRYAWRTRLKSGVLVGTSPTLLQPGRETLASLLRRAGYATACVGKWHLGLGNEDPVDFDAPLTPGPLEFGFDSFLGIPASLDMQPYLYVRDHHPERAATERIEGSGQRRHGGGGFWREGAIAPDFRHDQVLDRFADESVSLVEGWSDAEQPFFLYLALSAPHTPWLPTGRFVGLSDAGPYGDFTAQVDHAVGRVLDALEATGAAENTLVLFTSDNGAHWTAGDIETYGHRANGALRGQKADIHEGGHRVPFLARWPGRVPAGVVRDDLFGLVDVVATCASLVGAELTEHEGEDSVDQLRVLLGEDLEEPLRSELVHHSFDGTFALRAGRWKLIEGLGSGGFTAPRTLEPEPGGPTGQLYDLARDPAETTNLWGEHPEVVTQLTERLEALRQAGRSR